jgi:ribosome-binding protein aMBF1 (putative translation factor)
MTMVITKLKIARQQRGWSQQVLGFHASVAAADISKIENRRMLPYDSQAERLGKVLGLDPGELQEPAAREVIR